MKSGDIKKKKKRTPERTNERTNEQTDCQKLYLCISLCIFPYSNSSLCTAYQAPSLQGSRVCPKRPASYVDPPSRAPRREVVMFLRFGVDRFSSCVDVLAFRCLENDPDGHEDSGATQALPFSSP